VFCRECIFLFPTEEQQDLVARGTEYFFNHRCLRYNVKLLHLGYHPEIVRHYKCSDEVNILLYWQ